jgi:DNA ligase-1
MITFCKLFKELEDSRNDSEKTYLLKQYFKLASPEDAAWAIYLFSGNKLKRVITPKQLWSWAKEYFNYPEWLLGESYSQVGDYAETITLLLDTKENHLKYSLSFFISEILLPLQYCTEIELKNEIYKYWSTLSKNELLVFNKLIIGGLKSPISTSNLFEAISILYNINEHILILRGLDKFAPTSEDFHKIIEPETEAEKQLIPFPFFKELPISQEEIQNMNFDQLWIEWKYDSLRIQLIQRSSNTYIWTESGELINGYFPEIEEAGNHLPDGTVIIGTLLTLENNQLLPLSIISPRLRKQKNNSKALPNISIIFLIEDVLEWNNESTKVYSFQERIHIIQDNFNAITPHFIVPNRLPIQELNQYLSLKNKARENQAIGVRIRHLENNVLNELSPNISWIDKPESLSLTVILLYAQRGEGINAGHFNILTFGILKDNNWVPVAKTQSNLTSQEQAEIDTFVKTNTIEKFGPVRTLPPQLVFEIQFDSIQISTRHKLGYTLLNPSILIWHKEKKITEINTFKDLQKSYNQLRPAIT